MDSCISLGTFQFIFSGAMKCNFRCKKIHIIDDLENQLICMVLLHICQKHTHTFHFQQYFFYRASFCSNVVLYTQCRSNAHFTGSPTTQKTNKDIEVKFYEVIVHYLHSIPSNFLLHAVYRYVVTANSFPRKMTNFASKNEGGDVNYLH